MSRRTILVQVKLQVDADSQVTKADAQQYVKECLELGQMAYSDGRALPSGVSQAFLQSLSHYEVRP